MIARLAIAAAVLAGCAQPQLFGPPTEASCPPASTLTWDSFGKPFMDAYCVRCHASTLAPAQRHGAPTFHDFDTIYGTRAVREHIDLTTAAGPAAVNTSMPPGGDAPTLEERQLLGEWLACGAP